MPLRAMGSHRPAVVVILGARRALAETAPFTRGCRTSHRRRAARRRPFDLRRSQPFWTRTESDLLPRNASPVAAADLCDSLTRKEGSVVRDAGCSMAYLGLTRVLALHVSARGRFRFVGQKRPTFRETYDARFDPAWSRWQTLTQLDDASRRTRQRYVKAIVDRATEAGGRWTSSRSFRRPLPTSVSGEF